MKGNELIDLLCQFGIGVILEKVIIFDIEELNFDFPEQSEIDGAGIEIFMNYKNHKNFASYFSPTKFICENEVYKSPSVAETKVQNGLPVNGWTLKLRLFASLYFGSDEFQFGSNSGWIY